MVPHMCKTPMKPWFRDIKLGREDFCVLGKPFRRTRHPLPSVPQNTFRRRTAADLARHRRAATGSLALQATTKLEAGRWRYVYINHLQICIIM
jgi:hypothetical protein